MVNDFSEPIAKIVENYLNRLKHHLKGLPEADQQELVKEIHSHIYESFRDDPTENEVERILKVLDKLGEPADVVSSRMSPAIVKMGKKKRLPLYILAGTAIALFGVPLGLGGISILLALFITILALLATYYLVAGSLLVGGWIGMIASILTLVNPHFLDNLGPHVQLLFLNANSLDPTLNAILSLIISAILSVVGIVLLWLGKYMMRGVRFLFNLTLEKIKGFRKGRRTQVQYAGKVG